MERDALSGDGRELPRREEEFGLTPDREEPRLLDEDLFADADPRIFLTDPDNVDEARTFVWSPTGWFERIEGDSGAVEFSPVAQDEEELREWLSEQDLEITESTSTMSSPGPSGKNFWSRRLSILKRRNFLTRSLPAD